MSLAFRAGIAERDFWGMTAHNVYIAFNASQENLSRFAYRTAYYRRLKNSAFTMGEQAFFERATREKAKPQPQTLEQQLRMAQAITLAMGGTLH